MVISVADLLWILWVSCPIQDCMGWYNIVFYVFGWWWVCGCLVGGYRRDTWIGGAAGGFDCVVAFAEVCGFLPNLG